jgi:hypothetical protein
MLIYTGIPLREWDVEMIQRLDLGILVIPLIKKRDYSIGRHVTPLAGKLPIALDNGAYSVYRKGGYFDEYGFIRLLSDFQRYRIRPDMVVCPDLVARGMKSYEFSLQWRDRMPDVPNLYLAVQDGMKLDLDFSMFDGIFVGGTDEWKSGTTSHWVEYAHSEGKKCHVGRIGTLTRLLWAYNHNVDSVDSTTFVRNKRWYIVQQFREVIGGNVSSMPKDPRYPPQRTFFDL